MTEKQASVVEQIVNRSRFAGVVPLACALTGGDVPNLYRCVLRPLARAGYIRVVTIFARRRLDFTGPVIDWQPGQPEPNFGRAAYQIDKAWSGQAPQQLRACMATAKAAALYGAPRYGCKNPMQVSHDYGLSLLYEWYLRNRPDEARWWVGENMLELVAGEKCPDALLIRDGKILQAVELGGFRYGLERLAALYRHCRERLVPLVVY